LRPLGRLRFVAGVMGRGPAAAHRPARLGSRGFRPVLLWRAWAHGAGTSPASGWATLRGRAPLSPCRGILLASSSHRSTIWLASD